MKKQIMSLVLLTAVLGSTTAAMAGSQSDVPDNMLSLQARSAVDVLTKQAPKGPYDGECSLQELYNGCEKIIMQGMAMNVNLRIPEGRRVDFAVTDGPCEGMGEITLPNQRRIRMYSGLGFFESGYYTIINQAYGTCKIQLKLK
ncbi:hypothetical protein [Bdellovibrio sp. HCB-110]|uniref:hypothetical protein n=1 Tax=Bdellovibrio sp. HCB-110 TaxID=3391182 RepID=UPI0039B5455E